jgi:GDP-L-fucose synthase
MSDFWQNKRTIVTGGGGFLGSHVVAALRAAGCQDIFIPRHADYDLTHPDAVRRMFANARHVAKGNGDLIVLHVAGLSGGIGMNVARPADFYYQNVMMNALIFDEARRNDAVALVAAGAGISYPAQAASPLVESALWDGPPQAESAPYALAKRMLQVQSSAYWQQHHMPSAILILGSLYGPRDKFDPRTAPVIPSLISRFVEAVENGHGDATVWGTGKSTRDFLYARDAADAFVCAAEHCAGSQVVNIASGVETSIREVVEMLVEVTGFRGNVIWDTTKPDGAASRRFDVSKARRDFGWSARTPLRAGLHDTVVWYREFRQNCRR